MDRADPASVPAEILLAEDDGDVREAVARALERHGFRVTVAGDGLRALELFREHDHDLLVLDVMLPELDGIGLCRRIRESSMVPIVMTSARGDGLDVVSGLEAGADAYVVKPVDIRVLVARIRSLLRRAAFVAGERERAGHGRVVVGDLVIDTEGLEVFRAGRVVALAPTELRLLLEFAARPGIVLDRRTLLGNVWGYSWDGDTRVVDLCVQRLRKKIGADRIETVRGFGYKLRR
ncbi:response regulator transcription factor [Nonomuraea jiangxiensis]|uniref:DNA-binding response regulator, OmpR family, contains REC and winged-helix (WHTH) domain n=1 Tax=Nonomuraea jiangxiensis TaxID=633440 RepID=A0A1G8TSV7_9ACTN|nr:response regulator transcription factor [Nonomuraea jiangxiensis]SDJ43800.1 DNA-binding response regulator, OmpR family, contains REC and winged-helix (wHTH) domain [Nonomuraea jiangxiensis]